MPERETDSTVSARLITHGKRSFPYLFYAALSLAILGPLLLPGYILALDGPFGPAIRFTNDFFGLGGSWLGGAADLPLSFLSQTLSILIPAWLTQKVILFSIFFVMGLGMHRLLPLKSPARYYAGLLYVINPFTYIRFLAGQWQLLLVYAILPFAIKAFLDLLENQSKKNAAVVAILATLAGVPQLHGLILLFIIFLIIFLVRLINLRHALAKLVQTFKFLGLSAALFLILNVYWLVPVLTGGPDILQQINQADMQIFASQSSSNAGVMFSVSSMYGFWRTGYTYVRDIMPLGLIIFLFIFILFLAILGFISNISDKKKSRVIWSFGLTAVVAFWLAVGSASDVTRPLFVWLWDHVFFFRAMRDSQKLVAIICLVYAYLGALGVNEFIRMLRAQKKKLPAMGLSILVVAVFILPPVNSFTMFGFNGQLKSTDFPQAWYDVNDWLNRDKSDFNVLFLPWHQWMDYSWLPNKDKRLGDLPRHFFEKPIISGDNVETGDLYSQSTNPVSQYIEFLLNNKNKITNVGELLAPLNVKYIILVDEADYAKYDFLNQQEDLKIAFTKPGITIFQNQHSTSRVYSVDSIVYVKDMQEYLQLSKTQDVMQHLYLFGSGMSESENSLTENIKVIQKSPVDYHVEGTSLRYSVFTVPQDVSSLSWEYNHAKPYAKNLGFMPVFESSKEGGTILYTRFYHVYVPSYAISLIGLCCIMFYVWYQSKKKLR